MFTSNLEIQLQVMGFNHKLCGFDTVEEMWNFAQESEYNQLLLGLRFIAANRKLLKSLKDSDFDTFAFYYNGRDYKKFKYGNRLRAAKNRY